MCSPNSLEEPPSKTRGENCVMFLILVIVHPRNNSKSHISCCLKTEHEVSLYLLYIYDIYIYMGVARNPGMDRSAVQ